MKACCQNSSSIFEINYWSYTESLSTMNNSEINTRYNSSRRYSLCFVNTLFISVDTNLILSCPRSRTFIYIGWERVGKFKFVFVRRLHVGATLFCPEFIYYYIVCICYVAWRGPRDVFYCLTVTAQASLEKPSINLRPTINRVSLACRNPASILGLSVALKQVIRFIESV